jgi:hypothetical protein
MNRLTALTSTLTLGVALASASTLAATPPTLTTFAASGAAPATVFRGGATINGGANFLTAIPSDQKGGLLATINVPAADVGKSARLFLAATLGGVWYVKTAGGWAAWDGQVPSIVSFETRNLAASETIYIDDLEASAGIALDGNTLSFHVGYQIGSGDLVYSGGVLTTFSGAPASTCPNDGSGGLAPATAGGKRLCVLRGSITNNLQLTSNFDYVLSGGVFVGGDNVNSAELTVDAGVKIYGEKGLDFLVVNRGSKIHVNGSPSAPVIMTAAIDATATPATSGQFGGLIINGNAPINGCAVGTTLCEAEGEGSTGKYGGTNAADDSGNINYLQVKYAGFLITPTNELNGIAFQGVGNSTLVDYVQVYNSSDDGVEFFGGTVNAKHLYLAGNEDDSLDWTLGWTGKVQHVVIAPRTVADKAIEADNNNAARDSLPRAKPAISNVTIFSNPSAGGGVQLREGTGANLSNFVIAKADKFCLSIDHNQTFDAGGTSATSLNGTLTMINSVANCAVNFKDDADDKWKVSDWFTGQAGNSAQDVGMTNYINTSAVNALPAATLTDAFFDQTNYRGAVKDSATDWTQGWTFRP